MNSEIIIYSSEDGLIKIQTRLENETVWLSQEQMAELFPKRSGFYRDTLRAMVLPQYVKFRQLVQNIFKI